MIPKKENKMPNKEMLSKNFAVSEMSCKDNCKKGKYPKIGIVILLELVRMYFGNKYDTQCVIEVKSGNRCLNHNEAVQKIWYPINHHGKQYVPFSSQSVHMEYGACDFKVKIRVPYKITVGGFVLRRWTQIAPKDVYDFLDDLFPNSLGLGLYKNRNHADIREIKARWNNS